MRTILTLFMLNWSVPVSNRVSLQQTLTQRKLCRVWQRDRSSRCDGRNWTMRVSSKKLAMEHSLNSTRIFGFFTVGCLSLALSTSLVWAKATPHTEIRVNLLGQSCLLEGPFDESTLKFVHSIGPAQIYPNVSSSDSTAALKQTSRALETLRGSSRLPSLLDRYKEKLGKRLEAQVAFFESLNGVRNPKETALLLIKLGKNSLKGKDLRAFETLTKKLYNPTGGRNSHFSEMSDQLFELYSESIERDPEEEFHRAIKKLDIHYICSFEDSFDSHEGKWAHSPPLRLTGRHPTSVFRHL